MCMQSHSSLHINFTYTVDQLSIVTGHLHKCTSLLFFICRICSKQCATINGNVMVTHAHVH